MIKGYKVFNPDWTCKGKQYTCPGKFEEDGEISICNHGMHFCKKVVDCFNYYNFDPNNKVAEVVAYGAIKENGNKSCTNKLEIVRELSWAEVLEMVNTGIGCTGKSNSGNYNSGDWNSGDCNSGNWNSGDYNSDNYNSGNCNSGYCNSGNFNSGSWNKCNFSTGFFNTISQPLYLFNKPTMMSRNDLSQIKGIHLLNARFRAVYWIPSSEMPDEEKENNPDYNVLGGYLKTLDFKTACDIMWKDFSEGEKRAVMDIPNFDAEVFKEITGIDVNKEE